MGQQSIALYAYCIYILTNNVHTSVEHQTMGTSEESQPLYAEDPGLMSPT